MLLSFFTENISKPSVLIPAIRAEWKTYYEIKAFREYYPEFHKVLNPAHRPDKTIFKPSGQKDSNGNDITNQSLQPVTRIPIPLQKLIVSRLVAFTTGGGVNLSAQFDEATQKPQEELYALVQNVLTRNKEPYKNANICRRLVSETECAEIWYSKKYEDGTVELRCNIYSPSDGYKLMPVWDENRDMIAFAIEWEDSKTRYANLYTKDLLQRLKDTGNGWELMSEEKLIYGKIPIIYYGVDQSAWQDVQPMIERLETIISNFGDTNDYFGSPMMFVTGNIMGLAAKGESGKVLEGEQGSSVQYVTWQGAPEAIRLEIETLLDYIYTMTQTPNISFKEMKGLGGISGVAYDRILIDAHLKAKDLQMGAYGEGIQRRLNFLVSALSEITPTLSAAKDLEITPVFSIFKIDDEAERIDNAMKANGGKPVISHRESVAQAGLTEDSQQTYDLIVEEEAEDMQKQKANTSSNSDQNAALGQS